MSTPAPPSTPLANTVRFLLLTAVLLGFGTVFTVIISSKLDGPKLAQLPAESSAPAAETPAPASSASASTASSEDSGSLEGRPAPGFELKNLQGQAVKLADYRGKVVFLNFWATWCEPCKKELPSMVHLYEKLKGRPFEILAVSLDKNPVQEVPAFMQRTGIKLPFPILAETADEQVSKHLYHTTGVPESFLIGSDGTVIKHAIGSYEWDNPQILAYFDKLFKPAEKG